jgi:guanylate cyclase soluble subunit beta
MLFLFLGEFESVTIMFTDIVNFTVISSACRPSDIVGLLNNMFTRFDGAVKIMDVYKVAHGTILPIF